MNRTHFDLCLPLRLATTTPVYPFWTNVFEMTVSPGAVYLNMYRYTFKRNQPVELPRENTDTQYVL